MTDIPGLVLTGDQLPKQSGNDIADQSDAGQDSATLESLKRKIKAGQHPAFTPTSQSEALKSQPNRPAYCPATVKLKPHLIPAPPTTVKERPALVSSHAPHEPTPAEFSSISDYYRKHSPPFVPRDRRPSITDDHHSVSVDTRLPPSKERRSEPTRDREYMDNYAMDRRALHDAPHSDRRPLDDHPPVQATRPLDDRRYDKERQRSLSPAGRGPILGERRRLPSPPFIKPDESTQRVPSLNESLKTSPVASTAPTARVEPSKFATPSLRTDRRPVFEECRSPPPAPPKSAHGQSLTKRSPPPSTRLRSPPRTRATSPPPLSARVRPPPDNYRPRENNYRPTEYRSQSNDYRPGENSYRPSENSYRPAENSYRPAENSYRPEENSYRPAENSYRPAENSYRPTENSYRPAESSYRPGENSYRPMESSYRPAENSYRPAENSYRPAENSYRPAENSYRPRDVYERRERPEYVASGAKMELERRRTSPLPSPPRSTGGRVDGYRDRGREREPEVSHSGRHSSYPAVRKRSASPALIGYDSKRARYEPDASYLYNRSRSPFGARR